MKEKEIVLEEIKRESFIRVNALGEPLGQVTYKRVAIFEGGQHCEIREERDNNLVMVSPVLLSDCTAIHGKWGKKKEITRDEVAEFLADIGWVNDKIIFDMTVKWLSKLGIEVKGGK